MIPSPVVFWIVNVCEKDSDRSRQKNFSSKLSLYQNDSRGKLNLSTSSISLKLSLRRKKYFRESIEN